MKCQYKDCKKTIPLSFQFTCKCGIMYCRGHFNFHDCDFDYKKEQLKKLEKELPKVVMNKINKI